MTLVRYAKENKQYGSQLSPTRIKSKLQLGGRPVFTRVSRLLYNGVDVRNLPDQVFRQVMFLDVREHDRDLNLFQQTEFCKSLVSTRDRLRRHLGSNARLNVELEGRKRNLSELYSAIGEWDVTATISGDVEAVKTYIQAIRPVVKTSLCASDGSVEPKDWDTIDETPSNLKETVSDKTVLDVAKRYGGILHKLILVDETGISLKAAQEALERFEQEGVARKLQLPGPLAVYDVPRVREDLMGKDKEILEKMIAAGGKITRTNLAHTLKMPMEALDDTLKRLQALGYLTHDAISDEFILRGLAAN